MDAVQDQPGRRVPQPSYQACEDWPCDQRVNVWNGQSEKFVARVAEVRRGFRIAVQESPTLRVDDLDGVIDMVEQGSEKPQPLLRLLTLSHVFTCHRHDG